MLTLEENNSVRVRILVNSIYAFPDRWPQGRDFGRADQLFVASSLPPHVLSAAQEKCRR